MFDLILQANKVQLETGGGPWKHKTLESLEPRRIWKRTAAPTGEHRDIVWNNQSADGVRY